MLFLTIIIGIGLFINLTLRINDLEAKVKRLSSGAMPASVPKPAESHADSIPAWMAPPVSAPIPGVPVPPAPARASQAPISPEQAKAQDGATEFAVGSKVLTGVGALAVILGVSFFLRYAFENNLISEGARVFLGVIFGFIFIGVGHFLRKKYAQYGSTLIGAGLGILYLSVYAAYSFYSIIGFGAAFVLLVIITAGGVALALLYDSKPLVSYAFVGAYIIPLLLPLSGSVHTLFMYLIVLNVGMLLIARFKIWPEFTLASLAGASLLFLHWVGGPYNDGLFVETFCYATLLFFIFFITILQSEERSQVQ